MKYYQVGVVDYSPRYLSSIDCVADYSDPYTVGDIVPVLVSFVKEYGKKYIRADHIYWMENNIEGLKPGDPVIISWANEEMYKIEVDCRGVGIFGKDN